MQITDEIFARLKKEYDGGATYQELARKHNLSYEYIRGLILGKRPLEKISIDILFRMFPNARFDLEPSANITAANSGVNNGVIGINHGTVSAASVEAFRHKIQDEIIRADVDSESKVKILNIILNTESK